jgi:DNA-binding NtrC family response regulator
MTKLALGSGSQRPRILLVDDDALVLRSLARILRREFEVVTAPNAADAIAKLSNDLYAVITDHDLGPEGDGRAVLAEAGIRAPNAKRILISGRPQVSPTGVASSWDAFLPKPVERGELFEALDVAASR